MKKLKNIKPERVMHYFEEICKIPHGSGNTDAISEYCKNIGEALSLEAIRDGSNNVIIKKPAARGYESHQTVVLQAHLDMVCEKEPDCSTDFLKDGIEIFTESDFIKAKGTTLGGDDGIGLAMILAILEDKTLLHPPIEALFTSDEETGMFGAADLEPSLISGRRMINIDSEDEGIFTVSCAGGASAHLAIPLKRAAVSEPCHMLELKGLKGGHSGVEIDKGRYNSNALMGRFLKSLPQSFNIIEISGGSKENAIPARTVCKISTNADLLPLANLFSDLNRTEEEPDLKIEVWDAEPSAEGFSEESSQKIAEFLCTVPNGIIKMSDDIDQLVETSLNLGILSSDADSITAHFAVRSSLNYAKTELLERLKTFCEEFLGEYSEDSFYPAWEYRRSSVLRDTFISEYREMFGKEPKVAAIHAGLECGLFCEKLEGLDAISFGPDMAGVHTPSEKLSISSTERSYEFLKKVLERL